MKRDRGEYRPLYEVLLDGPDWQKLPADARLTFIALKLKCGALGIKVVPGLVESLTQWTGLPPRRCGVACKVLEDSGWVQRDGNVVWIVRGLEFEPTMDVANSNHRKYFRRMVDALPSVPMVARFRAHYRAWDTEGVPEAIPMASPIPMAITSPSPSPSPNIPNNSGAVSAFLELVPERQRATWAAMLEGWRQGQGYIGGKCAADEDIAQGLVEYLAANLKPDFVPKHVVRYVQTAERRRTSAPRQTDDTGHELTYLDKVARGIILLEEKTA